MIVYRIEPPYETCITDEGEDLSEWFSSKRAALRRFNEIIRDAKQQAREYRKQLTESPAPDYIMPLRKDEVRLEAVTLTKSLRGKALILALLSRRGFVGKTELIKSVTIEQC
jgi:hypothetical protein